MSLIAKDSPDCIGVKKHPSRCVPTKPDRIKTEFLPFGSASLSRSPTRPEIVLWIALMLLPNKNHSLNKRKERPALEKFQPDPQFPSTAKPFLSDLSLKQRAAPLMRLINCRSTGKPGSTVNIRFHLRSEKDPNPLRPNGSKGMTDIWRIHRIHCFHHISARRSKFAGSKSDRAALYSP